MYGLVLAMKVSLRSRLGRVGVKLEPRPSPLEPSPPNIAYKILLVCGKGAHRRRR